MVSKIGDCQSIDWPAADRVESQNVSIKDYFLQKLNGSRNELGVTGRMAQSLITMKSPRERNTKEEMKKTGLPVGVVIPLVNSQTFNIKVNIAAERECKVKNISPATGSHALEEFLDEMKNDFERLYGSEDDNVSPVFSIIDLCVKLQTHGYSIAALKTGGDGSYTVHLQLHGRKMRICLILSRDSVTEKIFDENGNENPDDVTANEKSDLCAPNMLHTLLSSNTSEYFADVEDGNFGVEVRPKRMFVVRIDFHKQRRRGYFDGYLKRNEPLFYTDNKTVISSLFESDGATAGPEPTRKMKKQKSLKKKALNHEVNSDISCESLEYMRYASRKNSTL